MDGAAACGFVEADMQNDQWSVFEIIHFVYSVGALRFKGKR